MSQPRHPRSDDAEGHPDDALVEQLRAALLEQAAARPVDPPRLLDDLHARLDRPRLDHHRPSSRSGVARFTPLLVAAAVLAVVGSGLGLAALVRTTGGTTADLAITGGAERHQVDREFGCTQTREVPLDGSQDEFVPDLQELRDPARIAEEYGAARYSFAIAGDTAILRLGNDDGSLGSVTTYRREDGEWVMQAATACTGAGADGADRTRSSPDGSALRLGTGATEPWPAPAGAGRRGSDAVLIDDRNGYTYAGLYDTHHSLYAQPCGTTVCFPLLVEDGTITRRLPEADKPVQRLDEAMVWPDDAVGRANPYQLYVAWDDDRSIGGFTAEVDGQVATAQGFADPSWDGDRLWVLLLPAGVDAKIGVLGTAASAERPSAP